MEVGFLCSSSHYSCDNAVLSNHLPGSESKYPENQEFYEQGALCKTAPVWAKEEIWIGIGCSHHSTVWTRRIKGSHYLGVVISLWRKIYETQDTQISLFLDTLANLSLCLCRWRNTHVKVRQTWKFRWLCLNPMISFCLVCFFPICSIRYLPGKIFFWGLTGITCETH